MFNVKNDRMVKVESRNTHYKYMCPNCSTSVGSYFDENHKFRKVQTRKGNTISLELETGNYNDLDRRLLQFEFIPTGDGSINGIEWKSPIWYNLNGLAKMLKSFLEDGMLVDRLCGSHINVGNTNMTEDDFNIIRRNFEKIFRGLHTAMESDEQTTKKLCGRSFSECRHYAGGFHPTEHASFLTVRENRIELRTAKLITANQYVKCIQFTEDILKTVRNNLTNHKDENGKVTRHKIDVTSKKLVALYRKYMLEV